MPRFFMNQIMPGDASAVLTGEQAAHARVLRLKPGEEIVLCDGQGTDYAARVQEITDGQIFCSIQSSGPSASEPRVHCTVYMGFAKGDKLEHVIQKATELGATEIVAFPSSRCVSRPDEKSLAKKLERWQKIAASAAEQSGRGRIPSVLTVNSYREAVERAARSELPLFPYENERTVSLRAAIGPAQFHTAAIMTGPEGGFSEDEVQLAEEAGMKICSLGPRILRCETAPLCALSAVLYAAGALE